VDVDMPRIRSPQDGGGASFWSVIAERDDSCHRAHAFAEAWRAYRSLRAAGAPLLLHGNPVPEIAVLVRRIQPPKDEGGRRTDERGGRDGADLGAGQ
jgi:hypothetical protein